MTELEIEELERKVTGNDSVTVAEASSVEALPDYVGEDMGNFSRKWEQRSRLIV